MKKIFFLLTLCLGLTTSTSLAQDHQTTGDISDYRAACYAGIDNLNKITGDNRNFLTMYQVARNSIGIFTDPRDMRTSMAFLRADIVASYLRIVGTFNEGQDFTGLVGNHSFETGELSWWNCFGFDLSKVTLADVTLAIAAGSVSPLTKAVTLKNWNEETLATENIGDNAVSGGDKKFYLNSNQLTMQPVFGLPAGIYTFKAKVACKPGLLGLNKVHLNALVVSSDILRDVLGIFATTNQEWEDLLSSFSLTEYIQPILENGKLYTASVSCKNLNTFSDGELNFIINEGDLVILGMDAGLVSFIGAEQYRADDIRLTGRWSAKDYYAAKKELAAELEGLEGVTANYNASITTPDAQPPFTYDKTTTENFNRAIAIAQDLSDDKLTDILGDIDLKDLSHLEKLDQATRNHLNPGLQNLKEAKDAFYRQGFIAPSSQQPYNILMKDDWVTLFTPKWTGNAITLAEDMTMSFSQKPGKSIHTLAFRFENANPAYTNRLRAFVDDNHRRHYLATSGTGLTLTPNPAEAATLVAMPSYTKEGEVKFMVGDKYLGTSSSANKLILTDASTLLRTTRTGLTVAPAAETTLTVTLPLADGYGTLILPFDAPLPTGLQAYLVTGIREDMPCIETEEQTQLLANTPYLVKTTDSRFTAQGISVAIQPSYQSGLLAGHHAPHTTQGTGEYLLSAEDGIPGFRPASGTTLAACQCSLMSDSGQGILCIKPDDATSIQHPTPDTRNDAPLYDLQGRPIATPQTSDSKTSNRQTSDVRLPRGIYITRGKKVMVR